MPYSTKLARQLFLGDPLGEIPRKLPCGRDCGRAQDKQFRPGHRVLYHSICV